jgi:pimeloyl-ACP methyl ester carboxylesterase
MPQGSYLLIHGGGSTARFWDRLVPLLDRLSLAVDLPGRASRPAELATLTVDQEVASVVADVRAGELAPPITIVAHSSGGLVVPGVVAALGSAVERVVLNAAAVPPEGGCGLDCMQERHRAGLEIALEHARSSGTPLLTLGPPDDPESFRTTYGGPPLSDDDLAFVIDPVRCVVDSLNHYLQPVHWSLAHGVPVTYVITTLDRPIPVALQEAMVDRLPERATVVRLETGHIPAVTDPAALARAWA